MTRSMIQTTVLAWAMMGSFNLGSIALAQTVWGSGQTTQSAQIIADDAARITTYVASAPGVIQVLNVMDPSQNNPKVGYAYDSKTGLKYGDLSQLATVKYQVAIQMTDHSPLKNEVNIVTIPASLIPQLKVLLDSNVQILSIKETREGMYSKIYLNYQKNDPNTPSGFAFPRTTAERLVEITYSKDGVQRTLTAPSQYP